MSLLLDTGVLYGAIDGKDEHHEAAVRILEEAVRGLHGPVAVTSFIVSEAFTLLLARRHGVSAVQALAAALWPEKGPVPIRVLDVPADVLPEIQVRFAKHYRRGLSFTDCASLWALETYGIGKLATFDEGFLKSCARSLLQAEGEAPDADGRI